MQARRGPDLICSRESSTPYALRGMLYCGACGRRMQGAACVGKRATRILYRCELGKSRSVPAELADHPPTVYLREDAVTPRLDEWIASLANPEDLAREQDSDLAATARHAALLRQLNDANRKVAALIEAVESGVAVADLTTALRRRAAERNELKARLERVERPHRHVRRADQRVGRRAGRAVHRAERRHRSGTRRGLREPRPAS
jgi:site-specific DNA recombinase